MTPTLVRDLLKTATRVARVHPGFAHLRLRHPARNRLPRDFIS